VSNEPKKVTKKRKAGRPKLPKGERQQAATTSLPPDLYRVAKQLGAGSVYRGLRAAVERCAAVQGEGG
jgi:hypothetical protein